MDLPEEIWLEICKFLEAGELCTLALVSKEFCRVASNNYSWERIVKHRYQKVPIGIENLKKNYGEINCMATSMINKYQSDRKVFEKALEKERNRQRKALEAKKMQRLIQKSLKDLED